uniref:Lipoprotein n=1 Tax=Prevotella sp. GTC17260 TaxID=3236796 RepID=A0AB33J729_9BACT
MTCHLDYASKWFLLYVVIGLWSGVLFSSCHSRKEMKPSGVAVSAVGNSEMAMAVDTFGTQDLNTFFLRGHVRSAVITQRTSQGKDSICLALAFGKDGMLARIDSFFINDATDKDGKGHSQSALSIRRDREGRLLSILKTDKLACNGFVGWHFAYKGNRLSELFYDIGWCSGQPRIYFGKVKNGLPTERKIVSFDEYWELEAKSKIRYDSLDAYGNWLSCREVMSVNEGESEEIDSQMTYRHYTESRRFGQHIIYY